MSMQNGAVGHDLGHEQGGRHALAGHVAEHDAEAASGQRNEVVVVAADLQGRLVVGVEFVTTGTRGNFCGRKLSCTW